MKDTLVLLGLAVGAAIVGILLFSPSQSGTGGTVSRSCEIVTTTAVAVGDDVSSTILSATSGRNWARVQQVRDAGGVATSSVFINFGATATVDNGIELSTSTPYLEFGFETDNPYTGIVTGITNGAASTTVLVTECR